jgi:hypothetical protein
MIELRDDHLVFTAPEVHPQARFTVSFQRTLRVTDDGDDYPLPAGLGRFPLEHVEDHTARLPQAWSRHGGVMLPMHATEAMWISFDADDYPWAVKVAAGKINAVSGQGWTTSLDKQPQGYAVVPDQPWLDGFNVGNGVIRQFVAMPLGAGYTAEEQITGRDEVGGVQLLAYPMKREAYKRLVEPRVEFDALRCAVAASFGDVPEPDMGLGAGGRIRQQIERDRYGAAVWDLQHPARCFVHLARAEQWPALTGRPVPTEPPTPEQYRRAEIPWFDYAASDAAVPGSDVLAGIRSVGDIAADQGLDLPGNDTIPVDRVIRLRHRRRATVSEWDGQ